MYRLEVITKFGRMEGPNTGYVFYIPYESWKEYRQLIFDNIDKSYVTPLDFAIFEHAVLREVEHNYHLCTKEEVLETLKTPPIHFISVHGGEPIILPDQI